ncbi:hypothetical protein [Christiangramia aquimixticola]|uniref:hypothetical protein n=1 Tax=Christiangramia aquimixticola TaxID=1697558 RepID=UPI003AA81A75
MNKLRFFSLIFFITFFGNAQQTDCACCTPNHSQFDFWIGDWEVFNEKGSKIGENLVKKLEDNCILNENWKGESGTTGKSYNYYDPKTETWNQLWLSNTGNILELTGSLENGKMVLKSEIQQGDKGEYYNKITWTPNPDGSVTQLWEILDAQGNSINSVFTGIYKRKNTIEK